MAKNSYDMSNTSKTHNVAVTYAPTEAKEDYEHLKLYSTIDWSKFMPTDGLPQKKEEPQCECGAFKVSGLSRGQPGHSSWCPWVKE